MPGFIFFGAAPPRQLEFMKGTGRAWGYWVLSERGKVILYNPTPCIHLEGDGLCGIYESRPEVCEPYFCRRHPVLP